MTAQPAHKYEIVCNLPSGTYTVFATGTSPDNACSTYEQTHPGVKVTQFRQVITPPPFEDADIIYAITRAMALEEGDQIDANIGDLGEISREHFKYPVYMTRAVFEIIEAAVNLNCGFSYKGIWHDVCTMSKTLYTNIDPTTREFAVTIGHRVYNLIAQCAPIDPDNLAPCITFCMPGEQC